MLELGVDARLLEEIEEVEVVVLAHPLKTRLIADAQIKTDRRNPRPDLGDFKHDGHSVQGGGD